MIFPIYVFFSVLIKEIEINHISMVLISSAHSGIKWADSWERGP